MSKTIKPDGGPAFPMAVPAGATNYFEGMSKREWFAGMALQGWYASMNDADFPTKEDIQRIAELCRDTADALLVELQK